jgi:hypothetical protein
MMIYNPSITQYERTEAFELQVARGMITGHTLVNIFGYQPSVGTTFIPAWEKATPYSFPAAPLNLLVWSSSASDVNCRIVISGLNAAWQPITEVVILTNGTTGVLTTNQFIRVNSAFATDAVYANPVGNINIGNSAKTATYAEINAGIGRTQMSIYSVPDGYTFYLYRVDAYNNQGGGGNAYGLYRVSATDNTNGTTYVVLQSPFSLNYNARRCIPFPYTQKTDLQWQVAAASGTMPAGVIIEGILIKNT